MRDELALAMRAYGPQHHQRVGERAEKGAEGQLVAAVAGEVAQQARPHLPSGKRERRDGDGEHRAGDADGGRRHRAQQGSRAGAAAVVQPGALDEPLRHGAAAVDRHQPDTKQDAANDHAAWQQPERVA